MTAPAAQDDVQLWVVSLDDPGALARVSPHLSPEEAARARRFLSPEHGRRFTVARGVLRAILGSCLDRPPADVELEYEPHGRPRVGGADAGRVRFNLSHSCEVALVAVTRARAVGVDVERVRPVPNAPAIARRYFAVAEQAAFAAAPEAEASRAFLSGWTRTEAFLKAIGLGLGTPPPGERARFSLRDLAPMPGYVGALAVEGDGWDVVTRMWRP
jgi:4'-phosphopantetheinyl transferase